MTKRYKVSLDGTKCRSFSFVTGPSYEIGRIHYVDEKDLQKFKDAGVFFIEPVQRAKLEKRPERGPTATDPNEKPEPAPVEDAKVADDKKDGEPSGELDVSSALGGSKGAGKKTTTRKTSTRKK